MHVFLLSFLPSMVLCFYFEFYQLHFLKTETNFWHIKCNQRIVLAQNSMNGMKNRQLNEWTYFFIWLFGYSDVYIAHTLERSIWIINAFMCMCSGSGLAIHELWRKFRYDTIWKWMKLFYLSLSLLSATKFRTPSLSSPVPEPIRLSAYFIIFVGGKTKSAIEENCIRLLL